MSPVKAMEPQEIEAVSRDDFLPSADVPVTAVEGGKGIRWRFYSGTIEALIAHILRKGAEGTGTAIAVCNVHMFIEARRDQDLARAIRSVHFALCDGQPVAWLASIRAGRAVPRVTGPDLFQRVLLDHLGETRVALVGGTGPLLQKICARLNPVHTANFLAIDPGQVSAAAIPAPEIIAALRDFKPSFVFVGLGCPKQEKWMSEAARHVGGTFIGVGAAFQYFAGEIARAPDFIGRLGLEWAYRLAQQPRLLTRYGRTNIPFLLVLLAAGWARMTGRSATAT